MSLAPLQAGAPAVDSFAVASGALEGADLDAARTFLRDLESAGISMLWMGEVMGREAFTAAQAALGATDRMVVGTGVARALERVPKSAAAASGLLCQSFPGRYVLGFGVSGASRERGVGPLPFMREYLSDLDGHYERVGLAPRPVRVLGAYSEGLIRLARERAEGLLTFMVTPEHTRWARSVLGDGPFLGVSHRVVFDTDPVSARSLARDRVAYYLKLPHQQAKLLRLGFGEEDFADGGSDRLIDAMFAWGSTEDVAAQLAGHLAAGADQVVVSHAQPASPGVVAALGELRAALTHQR